MATYRSPGVYVEEIPVFPPSVAEVETAIPAFIGYTQIGYPEEVDDDSVPPKKVIHPVAVKINGFSEFERYFGTSFSEDKAAFSITINQYIQSGQTIRYLIDIGIKDATKLSKHTLHQCMKLYFANGGGPCYIVSVGKFTDDNSINKGALKTGIEVVASEDEPTMLVVPEAVSLDDAGFKEVADALLNQAFDLKDRFVIFDVPNVSIKKNSAKINEDVDKFRPAIALSNEIRRYSAAYYPYLESTYSYNDNTDFATNTFKTIVIDHHFVSVDGAAATDTGGYKGKTVDDVMKGVAGPPAIQPDITLYSRIKSEFEKLHLVLPPSAAIAGVYVRVDESRGVWKAPANVGLANVMKAVSNISRSDQDGLNIDVTAGKSVNAIINMPGYGTQVFGARTLDGNDKEWRYINVRRFVSVVEESIKKSINWAVFEPNTAPTWVRVQAMIESYLFLKWRDGALAGAKPEQAYQVQVGLNKTMTPDDVLEGLMIIEIKLAVARPAEFIVLKIMQKAQES